MTNSNKGRIQAQVNQKLKQQVMSRLALETPRRTLTDLITEAMQDYLQTPVKPEQEAKK